MTAIEWLEQQIKDTYDREGKLPIAYILDLVKQSKKIEKDQTINAIMYALDEDGHTGEWKISFADKYYKELSKNEK